MCMCVCARNQSDSVFALSNISTAGGMCFLLMLQLHTNAQVIAVMLGRERLIINHTMITKVASTLAHVCMKLLYPGLGEPNEGKPITLLDWDIIPAQAKKAEQVSMMHSTFHPWSGNFLQ